MLPIILQQDLNVRKKDAAYLILQWIKNLKIEDVLTGLSLYSVHSLDGWSWGACGGLKCHYVWHQQLMSVSWCRGASGGHESKYLIAVYEFSDSCLILPWYKNSSTFPPNNQVKNMMLFHVFTVLVWGLHFGKHLKTICVLQSAFLQLCFKLGCLPQTAD